MSGRQSAFLRELAERKLAVQIRVQQLFRSPRLPGSQPSAWDRDPLAQRGVLKLELCLQLVNLPECPLVLDIRCVKFSCALHDLPIEFPGDTLLLAQ